MSATIWAPLELGTPASIWYPGGPVTDDGGGGESCDLPEQAQLFYDNFNNCLFLENFSHDNGTTVVGTFPSYGGTENWYPAFDSPATIMQGAATADLINTIQGAETDYTPPASGPVELYANVGIFSQLHTTGMVLFGSPSDGGEFTDVRMNFEGTGTNITLQVQLRNNYGDVFNSDFIPLSYCQWINVLAVPGNNTLHVYINDVAAYSSISTGMSWRYGPGLGHLEFNAFGEEANAFRIAAMYVTNPFF